MSWEGLLCLPAPYSNPRGVLQLAPMPCARNATSVNAGATCGCRETDRGLASWPLGLHELVPALGPEVMETSSNPFPGELFKGRQADEVLITELIGAESATDGLIVAIARGAGAARRG